MIPSPGDHEKLELFVQRAMRELLPRRAPHTLEQRVRAEIARRAAQPWWRKSFGHWPVTARASFIVLCAGLVRFAFEAGVWIMAGFDTSQLREAFTQPFSWMENGLVVIHAITGAFEIMLRNIPPLWLYGGVIFFATTYAALFGLGAAAYKALHAQR